MIIVGLTNSKKLAKRIAQKLNLDYEELKVSDTFEEEIHIRFKNSLKDQKVVLVQSLHPHPNYALFEALYVASVARDLGAKKVILVVPYLGYLREDKREKIGECVGMKVLGDILSRNVDEVISVEPHIHQHSEIKNYFSIPLHRLECGQLLRNYVLKNFKDYDVVGVGERAKILAGHISKTAYKYDKKEKFENFENKKVIVVDDTISSGNSIIKAIENLKGNQINILAVHGLFLGDAYKNLKEKTEKIVTSNTVFHETNEIDISGLVASKLMEL